MNAIYCSKHKRSRPCPICQLNHMEATPKPEVFRCELCGARRKKSEKYCGRCKEILAK